MLKEIYPGKDVEGGRRRWFSDDYFDLIVWTGENNQVSGFQLCYDKGRMERALTWKKNSGSTHLRIDDGEADPTKNQTPILVPDGACLIQELIRSFSEQSKDIDAGVRTAVLEKLRNFES